MLTGFDLCRAAMAAPGVSATERSVLMVLAIMANAEAKCWPPINDSEDGAGLTTRCVLSERAVQRAIQQLVRLGHITRKQQRHGVIYTVQPALASTPVTQTGVSGTGGTAAGVAETGDGEAVTPVPVAPKQPRTTNPKKASPPSGARARAARLPSDWKPARFAESTVAREVINRRGHEWARAALESFRAWAANAKDEDGKGRKLDWQQAWGGWVIRQDKDDGPQRTDRMAGDRSTSATGFGRSGDALARFAALTPSAVS